MYFARFYPNARSSQKHVDLRRGNYILNFHHVMSWLFGSSWRSLGNALLRYLKFNLIIMSEHDLQ